jgi:hypothetical protein
MNVQEKIQNKEYEVDIETFYETAETKEEKTEARIEYWKAIHQAQKQFQADLEEEFGTGNYAKKDEVFDYAWSEGHSSGYYDVYHKYADLVDLLVL